MAIFDDWRAEYEFALLMPMHTRKQQQGGRFTIDDIFGSKAALWGAEGVLGLRRLWDGHAELHWWKDREGALEPVGTETQLGFERGRGFFRSRDYSAAEVRNLVHAALIERPGMTQYEVWDGLGRMVAKKRVDAALKMVASCDGERLLRDRHWTALQTLPGM